MNLLVRRGGRLLGETADLLSRVIGCVVSRVGDRPGGARGSIRGGTRDGAGGSHGSAPDGLGGLAPGSPGEGRLLAEVQGVGLVVRCRRLLLVSSVHGRIIGRIGQADRHLSRMGGRVRCPYGGCRRRRGGRGDVVGGDGCLRCGAVCVVGAHEVSLRMHTVVGGGCRMGPVISRTRIRAWAPQTPERSLASALARPCRRATCAPQPIAMSSMPMAASMTASGPYGRSLETRWLPGIIS